MGNYLYATFNITTTQEQLEKFIKEFLVADKVMYSTDKHGDITPSFDFNYDAISNYLNEKIESHERWVRDFYIRYNVGDKEFSDYWDGRNNDAIDLQIHFGAKTRVGDFIIELACGFFGSFDIEYYGDWGDGWIEKYKNGQLVERINCGVDFEDNGCEA